MRKPIEERDVEETLDAVEAIWLATVEGSCETFVSAAHFADLSCGEARPASGRTIPGTERAVRIGGPGTPTVAEFAAAELGARLRMGSVGARHLMADALDARHRLPRLWDRVVAREVRVPWVRHVASRTRELSVEAAAYVDDRMAECADGRIPWSRFCLRLEGVIVAADPARAAEREEEQRRAVYASATRSSDHGMKGFVIRGPVGHVVRFDATVSYLAEGLRALGDPDPEDQRRLKACLVMANPTQAVELLAALAAHRSSGQSIDATADHDSHSDSPPSPAGDAPALFGAAGADGEARPDPADADGDSTRPADARAPRSFRPSDLPAWLRRAVDPDLGATWRLPTHRLLPTVQLYLHCAADSVERDDDGVVRWEGEGPVSVQHVRDWLAPFHGFRVTPVVDLAGQAPVDAYEIPDRHREAVRLRTPADCFPFAGNLHPVDLDHTEPYRSQVDSRSEHQRAGPPQSRMDNYGPLGRFHHRVKTHGGWQVAQPFDGIYVWRDPHGHFYLVDHTGTRKVSSPSAPSTVLELAWARQQLDWAA